MDNFVGLKHLRENKNQEEVLIVCKSLIKLVKQIIENENESKRRIKLDSDDVAFNLIPYLGGLETLFEIGFEEEDEDLYLPINVKNEFLKKVISDLESIEKEVSTKSKPLETKIINNDSINKNSKSCKSTLEQLANSQNPTSSNQNKNFNLNNNKFALKLQNYFEHVLLYESPSLKEKALNVIPIIRFNQNALAKYKIYRETLNSSNEHNPYDLKDFILLELLTWFKNEFFKWVNQPDCEICSSNQNVAFKHNNQPNPNEIVWMAETVEVYECTNCLAPVRFPRYNHPEKLLETRNGRCGEWANCFCLLLRAMNFDARYVLDWTDHVWCEVYSESQQRWLHADPCENILDKPLIYENGWGKKLSYIIAFSAYECIDVTWRYTSQFRQVMQRRNECNEIWLVNYTNQLSKKRQYSFDKSRISNLQNRLVKEIVEFLTPKIAKDGEDVGRQSGSLQWRLNRNEIQINRASKNFLFKLEKDDLNENKFQIQYNTVKDTYFYSNQSKKTVKGWENGVYKSENIQYKIEHDWKMCYLSRTNKSEVGSIEWVFDMSILNDSSLETPKKLNEIEIKFQSSCYENGIVNWLFEWNKNSLADFDEKNVVSLNEKQFNKNNMQIPFIIEWTGEFGLKIKKILEKDLNLFKLKAVLKQGKGENAWQHTQLFRQSLNDIDKFLLDVSFTFN